MVWTRLLRRCSRLKCLLIVVIVGTLLSFILRNTISSLWFKGFYYDTATVKRFTPDGHYTACPDVLNRMVVGHWTYRNYLSLELKEVEAIVRRLRDYHKLPETLQRSDGKCGNTVYEGRNWFRALCNPKGDTPCCYNNVCVNKSTSECHCPMCYDLRSKIHAELANWTPDDPKCKLSKIKDESQVCDVNQNSTLYFMGDSFVRQIYISALGYFEMNDSSNIFKDNVKPANRLKCDKHYRYIAECRGFIKPDILVCSNSTILHCEELYTADTIEKVLRSMRGLSGKENSWFIVGFGAHDSYNLTLIQKKLIDPLLVESKKNKWPQLVWYEPHAPGLLKTPMIPHQLAPNRISFNSKVKLLMEQQKIPNLRFYQLTEEVMSYDGSHYGKGVNDVKFQILLNYLLEQKSKMNTI